MKSTLGAQIGAGFGVARLVFVVIGVLSYGDARRHSEDVRWVTHTYSALERLKTVLSQVQDVETGQRGYVLTGNEEFLEPYKAAAQAIEPILQELGTLTAANPRQQGRLHMLASLVAERVTHAKEVIGLRQREGFAAAQQMVLTGRGKQLMDATRTIIQEIEAEERRLLQERETTASTSAQRLKVIIVLGNLVAFGLVAVASVRIQRELVARQQAEGALRQARDELEGRVQERTAALAAANAELRTEVAQRQHAEQRRQQQLFRLALLHQITRAIGERQDLHSIFLVMLGRLEQDLPIAFGCVFLLNPSRDTLTLTAVGSGSQAAVAALDMQEQAEVPIGPNGLRACLQGQTVYEPDTAEVHFPLPQRLARAGLRSAVAAPLVVEGTVFGLLLVARREAQGFSSGESEFLRQLSEHVAIAAHHAQLYARLQQAYDDLRLTQQAVSQQERLRALGQMASGIAHDINNAISPIALYVESLLGSEPGLSPRGREYLTTMQRAVEDITHTVTRLRQFYRKPEGEKDLLPVDLNQIVPQVIDLTRARWRDLPQHGGITIQMYTELEAGLPAILGSENELREALTNLIFNAVDAMPQGGGLTLRTRVLATQVVLEVNDTGVGMDEETRQRCLEPFYTTKGERGTGLGLAMVYGVMERHGAQIEVETALGRGTTVRLLFAVAERRGAPPVQSDLVALPSPHLRILVVDDDPLLRRSLQDVLQSEGHTVTVVEGGAAGIAAFRAARERQEGFDVVLTDLGMPEVDGREVARVVKHASPVTPVVLLTGWGQQLRGEGTLPAHVDHVLSKPPKIRELREALLAGLVRAERSGHDGDN